MNIKELRKKNKKELDRSVQELKKKLSDTRFKRSANQLKDVNEIGNTRKEIARILTILQENKNLKT